MSPQLARAATPTQGRSLSALEEQDSGVDVDDDADTHAGSPTPTRKMHSRAPQHRRAISCDEGVPRRARKPSVATMPQRASIAHIPEDDGSDSDVEFGVASIVPVSQVLRNRQQQQPRVAPPVWRKASHTRGTSFSSTASSSMSSKSRKFSSAASSSGLEDADSLMPVRISVSRDGHDRDLMTTCCDSNGISLAVRASCYPEDMEIGWVCVPGTDETGAAFTQWELRIRPRKQAQAPRRRSTKTSSVSSLRGQPSPVSSIFNHDYRVKVPTRSATPSPLHESSSPTSPCSSPLDSSYAFPAPEAPRRPSLAATEHHRLTGHFSTSSASDVSSTGPATPAEPTMPRPREIGKPWHPDHSDDVIPALPDHYLSRASPPQSRPASELLEERRASRSSVSPHHRFGCYFPQPKAIDITKLPSLGAPVTVVDDDGAIAPQIHTDVATPPADEKGRPVSGLGLDDSVLTQHLASYFSDTSTADL